MFSVFCCTTSKERPNRDTTNGRNAEFKKHQEMLNQERDLMNIITFINTIKDKMCLFVEKFSTIDSEHEYLKQEFLLFKNH